MGDVQVGHSWRIEGEKQPRSCCVRCGVVRKIKTTDSLTGLCRDCQPYRGEYL